MEKELFEDWWMRPGRLHDELAAERQFFRALTRSGFKKNGRFALLNPRGARIPLVQKANVQKGMIATFHFGHSFISRAQPERTRSLTRKNTKAEGRIYLSSGGRQANEIKALGGRFDRAVGRYWISKAQFESQPEVFARLCSSAAERSRELRLRAGRNHARPGDARRHQTYIERGTLEDNDRVEQIVQDEIGAISLGNIGATLKEREEFWDEVEIRHSHSNARLQCRMIIEIPHELRPSLIRVLVSNIGQVMEERHLPYWAAAHLPDISHGSDSRNVHCHIVYFDKKFERRGENDWQFAETKDREAQGAAWIAGLRERICFALNSALGAESELRVAIGDAPIQRRYNAKRYADLNSEATPGGRLGVQQNALERGGVPTSAAKEANNNADFDPSGPDAWLFRQSIAARAVLRRPVGPSPAAETAALGRMLAADRLIDLIESIIAAQRNEDAPAPSRTKLREAVATEKMQALAERIHKLDVVLAEKLKPSERARKQNTRANLVVRYENWGLIAEDAGQRIQQASARHAYVKRALSNIGDNSIFDFMQPILRVAWGMVQRAVRVEAKARRLERLAQMRRLELLAESPYETPQTLGDYVRDFEKLLRRPFEAASAKILIKQEIERQLTRVEARPEMFESAKALGLLTPWQPMIPAADRADHPEPAHDLKVAGAATKQPDVAANQLPSTVELIKPAEPAAISAVETPRANGPGSQGSTVAPVSSRSPEPPQPSPPPKPLNKRRRGRDDFGR
jgi:hypothetical protein